MLNLSICEDTTRIYQAITFDIMLFKIIHIINCHYIKVPFLKLVLGKNSTSRDLLLLSWQIVLQLGVFQRSEGRAHGKFSRGQAPDPQFSFLRCHRVSTPLYEFLFRRPNQDSLLKCVPKFGHFQLHCRHFQERHTVFLSICNLRFIKTQ